LASSSPCAACDHRAARPAALSSVSCPAKWRRSNLGEPTRSPMRPARQCSVSCQQQAAAEKPPPSFWNPRRAPPQYFAEVRVDRGPAASSGALHGKNRPPRKVLLRPHQCNPGLQLHDRHARDGTARITPCSPGIRLGMLPEFVRPLPNAPVVWAAG